MNHAEIRSLPSHLLFDIARNENAIHEARLTATEELIDRDDRRALHPDLARLANELFAKREAVAPADKPVVTPAVPVGPFSASVTTDTLLKDDVIELQEDD